MRLFAMLAIAAMTLTGCGLFQPIQPGDFADQAEYEREIEKREQRLANFARISDVTKTVMKAQIEQWNSLGVDVVLLSEEQQVYARAACGTMAALTETAKALRAMQPEAEIAELENALTDEALDWCLTVVSTLGPATESVPVPEPPSDA